jgi:hypothetical protein
MLGTLIGLFITSAGIVVGADSILWGVDVPGQTRVEKTCRPSVRSVAAFEGWYGEQLYLHRRFQEVCEALQRARKPLPVEAQADELIRKLRQAYQAHTGAVPDSASSLPPPASRHVASVAVAGFEGTTPLVAVRELRWENNRKGQWHLVEERTGKLSFQECGARFLGQDGIAGLLLDASRHFEREKRRPEVQAAVGANRLRQQDSCSSSHFTVADAKTLYKTAVRLTIDHAEEFLIENGTVGGRLHLLTIPPAGRIEEELIDPEQYVTEPSRREGRFSEFLTPTEATGGESS